MPNVGGPAGGVPVTFVDLLTALVQHPVAIRPGVTWEADPNDSKIRFCPGGVIQVEVDGAILVSPTSVISPRTSLFAKVDNALDYLGEILDAEEELEKALKAVAQ